MTLHTLSLAPITHHTNSPRVRLRRSPRARPQLTRPPLPTPVLRRQPRPPELRQSARPPVLTARCPTIARHPPPGAPPVASATPAVSAATAHPTAAAWPPPAARRVAGHERDARRRCQSRETVAVLRPSIAVDGEKGIHANRNFLPCSLCKTAREKNFLIWV
jgi:hypothetical protein